MGDKHVQRIAEETAAMPRRAAFRRVGMGGIAAGLWLSRPTEETSAQSSLVTAATEAATRRAINAINQALATGDLSLLDLAFAADYVNHTPHRSLQSGQLLAPDLAGLGAGLAELRTAVPDGVFVIDDVVASGDTAAVRATLRGTVDPAVVALPAGAGVRLSIGGAAFVRIVDGRVVESWDYSEAAEVVAAIPQPAPTATPMPAPTTPAPTPGEARDVADFQEVALEGVGTLLIRQGDTESLTIDAAPNVLRRIESEVRQGKLTIRPARSFKTREPITYYLTVKELTAIELSGAGMVEVKELSAEELRLNLDGAGSLIIEQLAGTMLEVSVSQNGGVQLGGAVDQQTVALGGSARYVASELESRIASVTTDGAAQATVRVSERLDARAGGASRIEYIGNPEVRENVSAAGSVTQLR